MTSLSQADFARRLGVKPSYVTELKKAGRLVMTADGKVDAEASEANIAATADPGKTGVAARHSQKRGAPLTAPKEKVAAPIVADEPDNEPGTTPDYQRSRARREEANAQLAEIEVIKEAGSLYRAAEADAVVADAATIFRTTLDSRRPLLVSQLAMMSDEAEIRMFLEDQDESLLAELHARFGTLAAKS